MSHKGGALRAARFLCIAIGIGLPAGAADIVAVKTGPAGLTLDALVPFERGVLTVSTPDGLVVRQEFETGGRIAFNPFGQRNKKALDGTYTWEVVLGRPSTLDPKLRAAARAARGDGDPNIEAAHRAASTRATLVQSGTFQIVNGAIVPSNLTEPRAAPKGGARDVAPASYRPADWSAGGRSIRSLDQVIPDDLIVQGSLCVGLDCVNNESFGFDTIRMKENNTRIKFDDTSTASGFPANDWQITANDSASGGASKFSIEDITGARVPFTLRAGAPTNALFVDSGGRIGFRTATPVLDLHIATTDTPAARLEQNNAGGFNPQTWDIAGNEANFFVRDVTGGSRLPFRIRPGAPTSSLDISQGGNIGIGTASPASRVHIKGDAPVLRIERNAGGAQAEGIRFLDQIGGSGYFVGVETVQENALVFRAASDTTNERMRITQAGNVGIGTAAPANPLEMASGAHVTAGGVWTNASSRELKQDIRELTVTEAEAALNQLAPVRYAFKVDPTEQHVGFIAQDVPDLVATRDRTSLSPMDIVAVLTRVVQGQQRTVAAQQKAIAELTARIQSLEAKSALRRTIQ